MQTHLREDSLTQCQLFYSASSNVQGNQNPVTNVSVSNSQSGTQRQQEVTEQGTVPWTYSHQVTPEMESILREFDNVRSKFINGQLNRYEQQDLAQFLGSQGSTPNKTRKRRKDKDSSNTPLKRRKDKEEPNTDYPMNIPRKTKKVREPKRNKEFQDNKTQKDLIELLDVDATAMLWCYEVCKGDDNFRKLVVDLEPKEVRGKLFKKLRDAKKHFECAKCGIHSTELAKTGFIYCDLCSSSTHGSCSEKDLDAEEPFPEEVKKSKFICVVCSGQC